MTNHRYTNRICLSIIAFAIILTVVFLYSSGNKIKPESKEPKYVTKLFDEDKVHTINIDINKDDWNDLQENAAKEEYYRCDVTIDGKKFENVAIRAKGNSSLSQVTSSNSERYSFKIEFDHYNDGNLCYGLDKLSLNNIIQDNTYMKDYISYHMMREMGVAAPLSSYINVSVNGESFGLYLAVEGIEEAFAKRTYGADYGNLYKPESADMGEMPDKAEVAKDTINMDDIVKAIQKGEKDNIGGGDNRKQNDGKSNDAGGFPDAKDNNNGGMQGGFGGMFGNETTDVALQYTDDDRSSYNNIFNNTIFDITNKDKDRLISSIKKLNEKKDLDKILDVDEILKYFVVHNYVDNYDSYTGSLMHNYYLYEKDGKLSIVAWDYNLAFGGFGMGGGFQIGGNVAPSKSSTNTDTSTDTDTGTKTDSNTVTTANQNSNTDSATSLVNYPIDTPVSGTTMEARPLLNALLTNDQYLNQYHQYFDEFLSKYLESGYYDNLIDKTKELIAPFVKEDKTAFCTYDEFEKGVSTLTEFIDLRTKSIRKQLSGTIPSTSEGQEGFTSLVDASTINISDMGSSGMGGGNRMGNVGNFNYGQNVPNNSGTDDSNLYEGSPNQQDSTTDEGKESKEDSLSEKGQMLPKDQGADNSQQDQNSNQMNHDTPGTSKVGIPNNDAPDNGNSPNAGNEPSNGDAPNIAGTSDNSNMPNRNNQNNWGINNIETKNLENTSKTVILYSASFSTLIAGLIFVKFYKKKR